MQRNSEFTSPKEIGGWVESTNNMPQPYDLEQRFWQFRISIKPSVSNLKKALDALNDLFSNNPKYANGQHPLVKIYTGGSYWNPVVPAPEGVATSDRYQVGKEMCCYMDYDSEKKSYQYPPTYYKELMLDIWKALETKGVEISYCTPPKDELEMKCAPGILSPFCYSSFKPYQYAANDPLTRHGLLLQNNANPKNFSDPLEGMMITEEDLEANSIKGGSTYSVSMNRIAYQTEILENSKMQLASYIKSILHDADKNKDFALAMQDLEQLISIKSDTDLIEQCGILHQYIDKRMKDLPGKGDGKLSYIIPPEELQYLVKKPDAQSIRALLSKTLSEIKKEISITKAELQSITSNKAVEIFLAEQKISIKDLLQAVEFTPLPLQKVYRNLCHLQTAEHVIEKEKTRFTEEQENLVRLLNTIRSSTDGTPHIKKLTPRFIENIDNKDDLDNILNTVQTAKFSKSHRLFTYMSYGYEKHLTDNILKRYMELVMKDENYPHATNQLYGTMHHAAYFGSPAIISELLKRKENINQLGEFGRTPLHIATYTGKANIVQLLVNLGADVNIKTSNEGGHISPIELALQSALIRLPGAAQRNMADDKKISDYCNILSALTSSSKCPPNETSKQEVVKLLERTYQNCKSDPDQINIFNKIYNSVGNILTANDEKKIHNRQDVSMKI